jgi:hypothetical protein
MTYSQCPSCQSKGWHRPAAAEPPQFRRCRYCGHDNRLLLAERALQATFDAAHRKLARTLDKKKKEKAK